MYIHFFFEEFQTTEKKIQLKKRTDAWKYRGSSSYNADYTTRL